MANYNKLTLIGYLARDPERRALPNGDMVAEFTVPYTERKRDERGDWSDGATAWYRVSAFGKQAETALESLRKGSPVYIEGVLLPREYTDKQGAVRTSLDVRCRELRLLEKRAELAIVPEPAAIASPGDVDEPDWQF